LAFKVARAPAFLDDNQRCAFILTRAFLIVNGYPERIGPEGGVLDDDAFAELLIGSGEKRATQADLEALLRSRITPPDLESEMRA
jgi:prophage maintenance system killer protein